MNLSNPSRRQQVEDLLTCLTVRSGAEKNPSGPVTGKSKAHGRVFGKTVKPADLVAKKTGNNIESGSLRAVAEKNTGVLFYTTFVPSMEERIMLGCGTSIINDSDSCTRSLLISTVHADLDRLIQSKSGVPSTTL